ncbi:MAG: hypothetical protein COT32_01400 [Candidatus Nealsonbacteria bacterium CG08_land_8_20_14_0_20_36_22]|uniref:NTP pyrophosphohydrolase MazG-like domain-containing protein n=1 Tax=Candidatus Nealsonbacteria bacterium CG08_land_8_20_14_0_20_36_22 TaxID=1974704 RepID=A0A2H0YNR8_9BACT|nr:MAG: hypothetical protein COT32_01400 [Candidatus Nealsonbacteria bacterium CG08_land_8_20_14_0_20_36_22]
MDFKEYQKLSKRTANYPNIGTKKEDAFLYPILGLAGESGEVVEKIKKIFRDDKGVLKEERKEMIKKELGDVLWYLAQVATELNLSLDDIAKSNIKKLSSRLIRGKISGNGDER